MSYVIASAFLIMAFINSNSKKIFKFFMIFMFLMFAFSYMTADWGIYLNKFYNYSSVALRSEPIFGFLNKTFNMLGFDYQQFLIVLASFICFLYYKIIKKYNKPGFILGLYFIFPFIMEVSQVRFACASVLVVYALLINAEEDINKNNIYKVISLIVIAGLIHYAAFLAFTYLLFNKLSKKETVINVLIILLVMFTINFLFSKIIYISGNSSLVNKINFVIKLNSNKNRAAIILSAFRILLFFFGYLFIYIVFLNKKKYSESNQKIIDTVFKYNIIALLIVPLIGYSTDLYRLQQLLAIPNYISYSFFLNKENVIHYPKKIYLRDFVFIFFCILFSFLSFYFLVLNNNNINTVFRSFFERNLIFGR